jgi:hypothetical protein
LIALMAGLMPGSVTGSSFQISRRIGKGSRRSTVGHSCRLQD